MVSIFLSFYIYYWTSSYLSNVLTLNNILLQYKYLKHAQVTVSSNCSLCNGNVPIRKFFGPDGLHLSNQGLSVFVANMKSHMRKILQIENHKTILQDSRSSRKQYLNRNKPNMSWRGTVPNKTENRQVQSPPFFMYPWSPYYNNSIYPPSSDSLRYFPPFYKW